MTGRHNAPATLTGNMSSRKLWCAMSHRGSDPYNVRVARPALHPTTRRRPCCLERR